MIIFTNKTETRGFFHASNFTNIIKKAHNKIAKAGSSEDLTFSPLNVHWTCSLLQANRRKLSLAAGRTWALKKMFNLSDIYQNTTCL